MTPLKTQAQLVMELMVDGQWRTLADISLCTDIPKGSVAAKLSLARTGKLGRYKVEGRRNPHCGEVWRKGIMEYRVAVAPSSP